MCLPFLSFMPCTDEFMELCDDTEMGPDDTSCDERDSALEVIYVLGTSSIFFSMFIGGFMADRYGPRLTACMGILLSALGSILFAFSDSQSFNAFAIAYILLGFGPFVHASLFHIANLYGSRKQLITSLIVGAFILSGFIFVIFESINKYSDVSRKTLFLSYCGWYVVILVFCFRFMPDFYYQPDDQVSLEGFKLKVVRSQKVGSTAETLPAPSPSTCSPAHLSPESSSRKGLSSHAGKMDDDEEEKLSAMSGDEQMNNIKIVLADENTTTVTENGRSLTLGQGKDTTQTENKENESAASDTALCVLNINVEDNAATALQDSDDATTEKNGGKINFSQMSFMDQLKSEPNARAFVWWGFHILRFQFTIGIVAKLFENLGDDDLVYTSAVGIIIPVAAVFIPVTGYLSDKYGVYLSVLITDVLGVLFGALLLIPVIEVQVVTYSIVSVYRVFMFSSAFSFYNDTFGYKHFGKLTGLSQLFAACLAQTQFGLSAITVDLFDGNYFYVNAFLLLLSLPLCSFPFYAKSIKRVDK